MISTYVVKNTLRYTLYFKQTPLNTLPNEKRPQMPAPLAPQVEVVAAEATEAATEAADEAHRRLRGFTGGARGRGLRSTRKHVTQSRPLENRENKCIQQQK